MPPTKRADKSADEKDADRTSSGKVFDEKAKDDRTPDENRSTLEQIRAEKRDDTNYDIAPYGNEKDPYGRTNHAMTADEVAEAALREGTLRPDGRPKQSVFYDDVALKEQDERRRFIEAQQWNEDGTPVDYAAIAARSHPVVAERGEPLTAEVAVTTPEQLRKANELAQEQAVTPVDSDEAKDDKGK